MSTSVIHIPEASGPVVNEYYDDVIKDTAAAGTLTSAVFSEEIYSAADKLVFQFTMPHGKTAGNGWMGVIEPRFVNEILAAKGSNDVKPINGLKGGTTQSGGAFAAAFSNTGSLAENPRIHWSRNSTNFLNTAKGQNPDPPAWTTAVHRMERIGGYWNYYLDGVQIGGRTAGLPGVFSGDQNLNDTDVHLVVMLSSKFASDGTTPNCRTHIQVSVNDEPLRGGVWSTVNQDNVILAPRGTPSGGGSVRTTAAYNSTESITITGDAVSGYQIEPATSIAKSVALGQSITINGAEYMVTAPGHTGVIDIPATDGDTVAAKSFGTDLTPVSAAAPAPVVITATPMLNTFRGVAVDWANLDTAATGRRASFTMEVPGDPTATFTNQATLDAAMASFTGGVLTYTPTTTFTYNDTNEANDYRTFNFTGGTRDHPIVIRPAVAGTLLNARIKSYTPHVIWEGWTVATSGGHRGSLWAFRPGNIMSDITVNNTRGWLMYADADTGGAAHFSGCINCGFQYVLDNSNLINPITMGVRAIPDFHNPTNIPTVVGSFLVWCDTNDHNWAGGRSEWANEAYDPVTDPYWGNERRQIRVFFNHFKNHTSNEELVACKFDNFWMHGNYIDECSSTCVARYGNRSIFTGNVQDVSTARCAIRLHGSNHLARFNVFDNRGRSSGLTANRAINVSVEDVRTDKYGPNSGDAFFTDRISHYYQGTKFADVQYNVLMGFDIPDTGVYNTTQRLITVNGPFSSETSAAVSNSIKNNWVQSSKELGISKRITNSADPSILTKAQWETANPESLLSNQYYLDANAGNEFTRATTFQPDLNSYPYPRGWVVDTEDPLVRFTELPTQIETGPLFDSIIQMVT